MKVRYGFVSNSSSSSFIIAFILKPNGEYELEKMLFGPRPDNESYPLYKNPYYYPDEEGSVEGWRSDIIANIVWRELKHQQPMTREQVIEEVRSGYFPGHPDCNFDGDDEFDIEEGDSEEVKKQKEEGQRAYWDSKRKETDDAAADCLDKFMETLPEGAQLFTFEYSDNDGEMFQAMEHGDLFRRFQNIKISKH